MHVIVRVLFLRHLRSMFQIPFRIPFRSAFRSVPFRFPPGPPFRSGCSVPFRSVPVLVPSVPFRSVMWVFSGGRHTDGFVLQVRTFFVKSSVRVHVSYVAIVVVPISFSRRPRARRGLHTQRTNKIAESY